MAKALLLLHCTDPDEVVEMLSTRILATLGPREHVCAALMRAPVEDLFHDTNSPYRRPQIVFEVVTAPGLPLRSVQSELAAVVEDIELLPPSSAYVMQVKWFIPAPSQPLHYHHLFVRKSGWSRADFTEYYRDFHSRMGFNTQGIVGYAQNYIDTRASEELAQLLGLASREIDSISELTMTSMLAMAQAPGIVEVGQAAALDEARFVDREQSLAFCSEVVLRTGDQERIGEPVYAQTFPAP